MFRRSELVPRAALSCPVVVAIRAPAPTAELLFPVLKSFNALVPTAVLPSAVLTSDSFPAIAKYPTAVFPAKYPSLKVPEFVCAYMAWYPIATVPLMLVASLPAAIPTVVLNCPETLYPEA